MTCGEDEALHEPCNYSGVDDIWAVCLSFATCFCMATVSFVLVGRCALLGGVLPFGSWGYYTGSSDRLVATIPPSSSLFMLTFSLSRSYSAPCVHQNILDWEGWRTSQLSIMTLVHRMLTGYRHCCEARVSRVCMGGILTRHEMKQAV